MTNFVPPQPELHDHVRHRKNLAEWVMWCVLLPFVPIAWVVEKVRRNKPPMGHR